MVWGVVYYVDSSEEQLLDGAEGLGQGYRKKEVIVEDRNCRQHVALMYAAQESHIDFELRPYSWYTRFVISGARQHALPVGYIARIDSMPSTEDPDQRRDQRERAVIC
jgi:hypothetical protein